MTPHVSNKARINVTDLVKIIKNHSLYTHVNNENSLRILMRAHVFAVWDFQSLLKSLQRSLTCVDIPWLPTVDTEARRFVNEIVLDEESDIAPDRGHLSHFELYMQAMVECGADIEPIETFIKQLRVGKTVSQALELPIIPRGVTRFVKTTMEIANSSQAHRIAAAFCLGREEVIPLMFSQLVDRLTHVAPDRWSKFHYYLMRHIDHDTEKHAPLARLLVERLCGTDVRLWMEAEEAARSSLEARIALWDEVLGSFKIPK